MRFRFEKSLRLGGIVRLYFLGSGDIVGIAGVGPRRKVVAPSPSALERRQALPAAPSSLASEGHTGGTLWKLVLIAAVFAGGFLLGHVASFIDAPAPDVRPTEVKSTATVPPPPPVPAPSPVSIASTPPVADPPAPIEVKPVAAPAEAPRLPPLTSDEVRETQAWLKVLGFDPGPIDGARGPQTKAAVLRYQAARQTEETGLLDRLLLLKVRKEVGH